MPELPEVEVITNELKDKLIGEVIKDIKIIWPKIFINSGPALPINSQINRVLRKGKYIIIELDTNFIVIHLRMTGHIIITKHENFSTDHLRFSMKMQSGKFFNFYDTRKFGRIYYVSDLTDILANVGIDALSDDLNFELFYDLLNKHNRKIKSFLLDQNIIAGLGNIYSDESLFLSGIHPESYTNKLSQSKAKNLFKNIRKILKHAIQKMGTTISDYKTTGGGFGSFQNYLRVYGRKGLPCFKCGTNIIKIKLNSRGTHFCPICQPENGV